MPLHWRSQSCGQGGRLKLPAAMDLPFADTDGHGSHCAGLVGAVGNNSLGVTGVSWQVGVGGE